MANKWYQDLPDTNSWQPKPVPEHVRQGLQLTCRKVEARIRAEVRAERLHNINNFDSGAGVDDIVRQELRSLLPHRYTIAAGVLNDRQGRTADECDVLILNRTWMPAIKLGATDASRRWHFPVESAYAVVEVKQSATIDTLDKAMKN